MAAATRQAEHTDINAVVHPASYVCPKHQHRQQEGLFAERGARCLLPRRCRTCKRPPPYTLHGVDTAAFWRGRGGSQGTCSIWKATVWLAYLPVVSRLRLWTYTDAAAPAPCLQRRSPDTSRPVLYKPARGSGIRPPVLGSHDTMTYCLDKSSAIDPSLPKLLLLLEKYVPFITRSVILRWSTTQTFSVVGQMDTGIRYLDLRIGHRPDAPSPDLHFVHGFYTSVTVEEQPTLRNMWKQGYQVIVSYGNPLAMKYDYLWSSIPYWWANTTNKGSLINFLESEKHKGRPAEFFVAGLNLTENASYILIHPFGSMKRLTLPKLPFLYKWVQKQHPGVSRDAINIIAEDLIGSDHFVSAVIHLNVKLLLDKN
ncbi:PI-PLC X domain-containing protein 1 isoform X2 [Pseudophryne corroboree]|uniref:PI-PLC X domain-containing protein 1 isoform X2 n=1 Tax=Pseudophryne corroboree TaxID=495146 RepID=UPI00308147E7